ncbi:CAAX amino protease [Salmonella enterica subsp. enterica serovar Choleraesuis]|nr:CAAX amino protease [Salmonella enterica subsp. enterica serovar Choleraesuis]
MWVGLALALLILGVSPLAAGTLLVITVLRAAVVGVVAPWMAVVVIISFVLAAVSSRRYPQFTRGLVLELLLVALAVALTVHLVPGFTNLKVLNGVHVGPHSLPFSMYYNFDKALVPFVLLLALPGLFVHKAGRTRPFWHWGLLAAAIPGLLLLAVALGGLRFEPHLPAWLGKFALANLFFVCLAEEALFRGYLQRRLMHFLSPGQALAASAVIFGLLHCAGGPLLVIFAGLAGVIYGLAWLWSGRLWVAVLFHFALNCVHLLLFTYPALQHSASAGF